MNRPRTVPVNAAPFKSSGPLTRRQFLHYAARLGLSATAIAFLDGCGIFPAPTPTPKVRRIGFLASGSTAVAPSIESLRQGLRELGYVEGQNIMIE